MESQSKMPDIEKVLSGVDRDWQKLVNSLQEGQGRPASPEPAPPESLAPEAPAPANGPAPGKLPAGPRGQKVFNIAVLLLLAAALAGLGFVMVKTQMLDNRVETGRLIIRGQDGLERVWLGERDGRVSLSLLDKAGRTRAQMTLEPDGSPALNLFDPLRQQRVELKLGPAGEPLLRQVREPGSLAGDGGRAPVPGGEAAASGAAAPAPGNEAAAPEAAAPQAPAPQTPETARVLPGNPAGSPQPEGLAAPEAPAGGFVGSRTSNKYHYPECKWAKTIRPERLLHFGSAAEAREKGYIPCPHCIPAAR